MEPGVVILLFGDARELNVRVKATGRPGYDDKRLRRMQDDLEEIYRMEGVRIIDTHGRSIVEVTKLIAEIVHRDKYVPCDLHNRLLKFQKGGKKNV